MTRGYKTRKAHLIKAVIEHQAGPEEAHQEELVLLLTKAFFNGFVLLRQREWKISIEEVVAMRHWLKISVNQILEYIKIEKALKGNRVVVSVPM